MDNCERCGRPYGIGDWPFCPHGRYRGTVIGDDIPGGFVQENFGDQPEVFYSQKAMDKRAKELGLVPFVRHAGPHDKHVSRWVSVDLDAATALVSRAAMGDDAEVVCDTAHFEVKPL